MALRFVQINVHHPITASAGLLLRLSKFREDIVLVQEPWVVNDLMCGLKTPYFKLFYVRNKAKPRACILAKSTLNIFLLSNYSDRDTVTVSLEVG